ncbi:MAG: non-homologous end-joining DNA ligase [Verrucomicrobiales bacterium]
MGKETGLKIKGKTIRVSNLDKVMFPRNGFTKGEVIDYYIKVSRFLLPHLKSRPLTLKRYPEGIEGEHFYEKNAPRHTPAWIKTAAVERKNGGDDINFILANDLATLVWTANMANLEMHVFLSKAPKIQRPTSIVFDLDPGPPANVLDCAQVALWIKDILDQLKLQSFIKSSGSKGLQIYIPLNTTITYEKTQPFSKAIADYLAKQHPDIVVSNMARDLREGKVFIDWSQNSEHKTTVAVYSLRAKREEPFISMPVAWEALKKALKQKKTDCFYYTPAEAIEFLETKGDLFEPVLKLKQKLPTEFANLLAPSAPMEEGDELNEPPETPAKAKGRKKKVLKGVGDHSIAAYDAKRDFSETAEPKGEVKPKKEGERLFVIQKHKASHLHYDFRLEMDGVLRSWAVPKGPPYTRAERRLAMWVEDHPMSYARFEGTIPKGNYGAGTVMVWDIGSYEVMDGNFHAGKLHLKLKGKKLKGEWILVRGRPSGDSEKQHWFLIKGGESMMPLTPKQDDKSALTGRSLDQITSDNDAQWKSNR